MVPYPARMRLALRRWRSFGGLVRALGQSALAELLPRAPARHHGAGAAVSCVALFRSVPEQTPAVGQRA